MLNELISDDFSKDTLFFCDRFPSFSYTCVDTLVCTPISLHILSVDIVSFLHLCSISSMSGKHVGFCELGYLKLLCENVKT